MQCHAKINLFLKVTDKKGGYHRIDSVFHKLELADTMEIKESDRFKIECAGEYRVPADKKNILHAVYEGISSFSKIPPLKIHLEKKIPTGGGLGGGSTDAASLILHIQREYRVFSSYLDMLRFSFDLGRDIPFFLIPENSARVKGFQNIIKGMRSSLNDEICILYPGFESRTGRIYEEFDNFKTKNLTKKEKISKMKFILKKNCSLFDFRDDVFNDLEVPFLNVYPEFKKVYEDIGNKSKMAMLTGSGSAVYFIPQRPYRNKYGCEIIRTRLLGCSQVARQRFLASLFGGSNPSTPAYIRI